MRLLPSISLADMKDGAETFRQGKSFVSSLLCIRSLRQKCMRCIEQDLTIETF